MDRLKLDAGYCHFLGLLDLVQRLMEVPEELVDDFGYLHGLNRSVPNKFRYKVAWDLSLKV